VSQYASGSATSSPTSSPPRRAGEAVDVAHYRPGTPHQIHRYPVAFGMAMAVIDLPEADIDRRNRQRQQTIRAFDRQQAGQHARRARRTCRCAPAIPAQTASPRTARP
jgi:hypothetical protein